MFKSIRPYYQWAHKKILTSLINTEIKPKPQYDTTSHSLEAIIKKTKQVIE